MDSKSVRALEIAGSSLLRQLPEPDLGDGDTLFSELVGVVGDTASSVIGGPYGAMINEQLKVQQEMLQVSLISNIHRSKHETEMTPVRNLRVG